MIRIPPNEVEELHNPSILLFLFTQIVVTLLSAEEHFLAPNSRKSESTGTKSTAFHWKLLARCSTVESSR